MVEDRLTDGRRIAQLLASEVTGHGDLGALAVTDADPDAAPTPEGTFAYAIDGISDESGDAASADDASVDDTSADSDARVAAVFVQPDRVRIEFARAVDVAADAAEEAGLRVRPKAVRPPKTLVFVEDGAQVKRTLPVFRAVGSELGVKKRDGRATDT